MHQFKPTRTPELVKHLALGLALIGGLSAAADEVRQSVVEHRSGSCDGSGGILLDPQHFAVINDEDDTLRVYRCFKGPAPIARFDLRPFLENQGSESDLEAMARVGQRIYCVGSHSRSKGGKEKESRHRFFAVDFSMGKQGPRFKFVGKPYKQLLDDVVNDPKFEALKLKKAREKNGNDKKGFNIEGLCSTPEGGLLFGLRGPIRDDRAIILPLLNPNEVLAGSKPRWSAPILLDMHDRGIRGLARTGDEYLIAAERQDGKAKPAIYHWDGKSDEPERFEIADLDSFDPEALVPLPPTEEADDSHSLLILSDDGSLEAGLFDCANQPLVNQRRFRTLWLDRIQERSH